jgi:sarcosine oxidase subunit delta
MPSAIRRVHVSGKCFGKRAINQIDVEEFCIMALLITCPICGKRNGYEFRFGGEDKGPRPEEEGLSPEQWCDYVHLNKCVAGVQKEWWVHKDGCGVWFTIHRDTTTNLEVDEPEATS